VNSWELFNLSSIFHSTASILLPYSLPLSVLPQVV
jgi:hypothetical protein